ncbi:patatin-like phospholipase family protein [Williamsia sterculiae]|uniref:NTE family protein n=1 Tax=Williamsia sterculiae TaxID=1344003 RepID=A0A1N7DN13_9NOCA|nr:patatin-like phospholipase family protein [Williamsia sterculiae]SIR77118.1 NTE family protein [Williamsia sterculiae]
MRVRARVAVALGSGGARGYAHIGAVQVLQERGHEIVAVAGSSMGALVGGLACADKLDDYVAWVLTLKQLDVMRLMDVSLTAPGVIHADKILDKVREIVGDTRIEDLPIPFTAVATDLTAGRPLWFQRGPLDTAIRASIAIPGVITPFEMDDRVLVDGGILDPLPVAPTAASLADFTIGVSIGTGSGDDLDTESHAADGPIRRLRRTAGPLLESDFVRSVVDRFAADPPRTTTEAAVVEAAADLTGELPPGKQSVEVAKRLGRFAVMNRSLDVMQEALARHQLAAYPPDVLVRVPRNACRSMDFHRAGEMIALGRRLTAEALDTQLPS